MLLHRRTDFEWWGIPGGVMETDEDIQRCARREVEEETGLEIGKLELVGVYTHPDYDVVYPNGDQVQQFTVCFTGVATGGRMQPDGAETTHQAFFSAAECAQFPIPPWYRAMVEHALDVQRRPFLEAAYRSNRLSSQMALIERLERQSGRPIAVSAMGIVVDEERVLVVRDSVDEPWRLPVAYLSLGESGTQTAVRAIAEQTGVLDVVPQRILGVYSSPDLSVPGLDESLHHVGIVVQAGLMRPLSKPSGERLAFLSPEELGQAQQAASLYQQIQQQLGDRQTAVDSSANRPQFTPFVC